MEHRSKPRWWVLLFGLLAAMQIAAQLSTPPPTGSDQEKCLVQGLVTAIPSGEPLKGAEVFLTQGDSYTRLYSAATDASGLFSLNDIEPGAYKLWMDKSGYESPARQCDTTDIQEGDELSLSSGQKLTGLKFKLISPAVITGTVFDPSGDPLFEADVEAVRFYSYQGERRLAAAGRARSDDRGQFRIYHLSPGRYALRVREAFHVRRRFEAKRDLQLKQINGFLPVYYPDTTELRQATLFDLHPGEELRGVDFTAHPSKVLRILVHAVNGLTGEPMNDGTVAIEPLPPAILENSAGSMSLSGDGPAEITDLVPGRYIVSVDTWEPAGRRRWGGWTEIELTDSSLANVQVKTFPSHDVAGRIQAVGGKKLDSTHMQVHLNADNDLAGGLNFTSVNGDGTFILTDVKQDTYSVDVAGLPAGYYLKSARLGSFDVLESGLKIGSDRVSTPLVLEASPSGAQVDGTVQTASGKAACLATVVLIPAVKRRSLQGFQQTAEIDHFGHFLLRGIAPGDYTLFAWQEDNEVDYLDPASLKPYENQGQPVHFNEGDHRSVVLKVAVAERKDQ